MSSRFAAIWAMFALLAPVTGCEGPATPPGPVPSLSSSSLPTASSASKSADAAAPSAAAASKDVQFIEIVVSKSQILVGKDRVAVVELPADRASLAKSGLDEKYKRAGPNDLYVVPLANKLKELRDADKGPGPGEGRLEAMVTADADTPYRLLIEVLYTLGQSGYLKYHLMRESGDKPGERRSAVAPQAGRGKIATPVKDRSGDSPSHEDIDKTAQALAGRLALRIADGGHTFRVDGKALSPGCESKTEDSNGITIARKGGKYDVEGLERCAKIVKAANPKETSIIIVAVPATPYRVVIDTMDAVRGRLGSELFSQMHFAVDR